MYGSDRCLYELLRGIDKEQFVPAVVLPFEGELSEKITALGIPVSITDPWVLRKGVVHSTRFLRYLLTLPVSIVRLARIIRNGRIDVVYSNTSVIPGAALAAFVAHRPHIVHLREFYDNYPGLSPFYSLFLCLFSRNIVAISSAVAAFVKKRCPGKVTRVYDGIDLERFGTEPHAVPDVLSAWKHERRIIIANVGRISPIKGQELFIDAARVCMDHTTGLRFLVVGGVFRGNEPYMELLRKRAASLGMQNTLLFTGFRDDADDIIQNSDIIVLSTIISEGLGQVVMEGMAAGRAVVAPGKGGPLELIEHGTDGIIYEAGSSDALARALLGLAADPALMKSIGEKAREKARRHFGIRDNIQALERIIKKTARDTSGNARIPCSD